jgi:outer membrane immunogenic protein
MRWVICVLAVLGCVSSASAQGLDILRGSMPVGYPQYPNWSGFYAGGQLGYSDGNADFSNSTSAPIAYVLRNTALEVTNPPSEIPVLSDADHGGMSYGGFFGYNTEWQGLVLGFEGTFTHTSFSLLAPSNPIARSGLSDGNGNSYTVVLNANGTATNLNYGSVRARFGWILGNFLPYGFMGGVVGVANINVNASVLGTCDSGSTVNCSSFSFSASSGRDSALIYGASIGGGLDYLLTQHLFLRSEFEYVRFAPIFDVPVSVISATVGAGFKF